MESIIIMNSFVRGGDIKKNIGIGLIEGLKYSLQKLQKEKAVKSIYTSNMSSNDGKSSRILYIKLDLAGTGHVSPDSYLIQFLQPEFFSGATAERENFYITGISDNLADLRNNDSLEFSMTLFIKDQYVEDFPRIDPVW